MGAMLGNLEGGSSTGDFERGMKGALGIGLSLSEGAQCGGPRGRGSMRRASREGSFIGDPGL